MPAVFIDTNVFLYAIGADSEFRAPAKAILEAVAEGRLLATTNTEVVQEVLYVLTRRGARDKAAGAARAVLALFPSMLAVTPDDLASACELLQRSGAVSVRDAIHAATMLRAGLADVLSADRDFDSIAELRRIDPMDARALGRILGR